MESLKRDNGIVDRNRVTDNRAADPDQQITVSGHLRNISYFLRQQPGYAEKRQYV